MSVVRRSSTYMALVVLIALAVRGAPIDTTVAEATPPRAVHLPAAHLSYAALPTPTPPPTATPLPLGGPTCAWTRGTPQPGDDVNLHYWHSDLRADSRLALTISGTYPAARYLSFAVYALASGTLLSGLSDRDLPPDPGSINPFAVAQRRGRGHYIVHIVFTSRPTAPTPGIMYVEAPNNASLSLWYRVYLPDQGKNDHGSVGLPTISVRYISTGSQSACPIPGAAPPTQTPTSATATALARTQPAVAPAPTAIPAPAAVFTRLTPATAPGGGTPVAFIDPNTAALRATLPATNSVVAVVRFLAPVTPHTLTGDAIGARVQVRYWSLCIFGVDGAVRRCIDDEEAPQGPYGQVTVVLGAFYTHPPIATATNGIVWVDLGDGHSSSIVVLREIAPAPFFSYPIQVVAPGAPPSPAMGSYAPTITLCTPTQFQRTRCLF